MKLERSRSDSSKRFLCGLSTAALALVALGLSPLAFVDAAQETEVHATSDGSVIVVLVFACLALLLAIYLGARGNWKATAWLGAAVAVLLVFGTFFSYSTLQVREVRPAEPWSAAGERAVSDGEVVNGTAEVRVLVERESSDSRIGVERLEAAEIPPPVSGIPRFELPDDLALWRKASETLGFEPEPVEKPWVPDAAGSTRRYARIAGADFIYWAPGTSDRLAAYSPVLSSPGEAREAARRSVQEKLAMLALIRARSAEPELDVAAARPLAVQLASTSYKELDLFEQSSLRSYARVHRAAVLTEADHDRVEALAARVRRELARGWAEEQERIQNTLWTGASLLALAFAMFLLYTFVNAGTKGYFAVPLRVLSALIFLLLCAVVYFVRTRLGAP